jgi:hypothetical protein
MIPSKAHLTQLIQEREDCSNTIKVRLLFRTHPQPKPPTPCTFKNPQVSSLLFAPLLFLLKLALLFFEDGSKHHKHPDNPHINLLRLLRSCGFLAM